MKVVYLAHPYRNGDIWGTLANILSAHRLAREIWAIPDLVCISPCSNTALMDGNDIHHSKWLDGDFEILRRCDALYLSPGWENSNGCVNERNYANDHYIPAFDDMGELKTWAALTIVGKHTSESEW